MMPPMPEALKISLRYFGPDAEMGTMAVDDVVDALDGFAGAYGKIAAKLSEDTQHQLRIAGIHSSAFELLIVAWLATGAASGPLKTIEIVTHAARWVVANISSIIAAKKHIKGKPYKVDVKGNNNTVLVINAEGAELEIPPQSLEFYKSKLIDSDLNKIAAPLRIDKIDSVEIMSNDGSGNLLSTTITREDREYFRPGATVTTSQETDIPGMLISLNKETNRGTFSLANGRRIPYHYTGGRPERFHQDFSFKGPVKATCTASFDDNLSVISIEIKSIEKIQGELPLQPPPPTPSTH
jgi:hypothetical protein